MNQVLREGAEMASMGWLLGVTTVLFFSVMVGFTVWAYSPSRREMFARVSLLPFEGERASGGES